MKTFSERVIVLAQSIPTGRVTTYGAIARAAGGGGQAARSVTAILAKAAEGGAKIPFHRIVYSGGKVWVDDTHRHARMKLYQQEGIQVDARGKIEDFPSVLFRFI